MKQKDLTKAELESARRLKKGAGARPATGSSALKAPAFRVSLPRVPGTGTKPNRKAVN